MVKCSFEISGIAMWLTFGILMLGYVIGESIYTDWKAERRKETRE